MKNLEGKNEQHCIVLYSSVRMCSTVSCSKVSGSA